MRNLFFIFGLTFIGLSCSLSTSENANSKKDPKENLRVYLAKNYEEIEEGYSIEKITINNVVWINSFYHHIKHLPIWVDDSLELNKNGEQFLKLLNTSYNYGLDTNFYNTSTLRSVSQELSKTTKNERYATAAKLELLLTNAYFLLGKDLNYGIVPSDSNLLISELPRKKFDIDLVEILLHSFKTDSLVFKLLSVQPRHSEYMKLQKQFENYLKMASLSHETVKVEHFKLDSLKAYEQSRKALILFHYLNENGSDSAYIEALKLFQVQHGLTPDGLIGKHTANALSMSPYSDYEKALLSLEKWRWKEDWGSNYIYVNIPSCEMKVYQNNEIKKRLNVVVGIPTKPTAEINAEMEYMIIYPFWNLPYSIATEELLPKIKKDSTYLQRNGYEVFTNKHKPLNDNDINWGSVTEQNFNYKIRQVGGGSNSLGLIKFIFPNEHSIYFHDTPSKSLFKNDVRAYSHGCVRVHHPLELAEVILSFDNNKYNIDSVNTYITNHTQKRITLNKKIPVHIHYLTCGTDTADHIVFYKDFYNKDDKLKELMKLKNYSVPEISSELVSK